MSASEDTSPTPDHNPIDVAVQRIAEQPDRSWAQTGHEGVALYLLQTSPEHAKQQDRLRRGFEAVNAPRMRADRARAFWLGAAWVLFAFCAALLGALIFGWAKARADEAISLAPAIMMF